MGYYVQRAKEIATDWAFVLGGGTAVFGSAAAGDFGAAQIAKNIGSTVQDTYLIESLGIVAAPTVVSLALYYAFHRALDRGMVPPELEPSMYYGVGSMAGAGLILGVGMTAAVYNHGSFNAAAAEQPVIGETIGCDTGITPSSFDMSFPGMELSRA